MLVDRLNVCVHYGVRSSLDLPGVAGTLPPNSYRFGGAAAQPGLDTAQHTGKAVGL